MSWTRISSLATEMEIGGWERGVVGTENGMERNIARGLAWKEGKKKRTDEGFA